jgi:hypothetical protein
MELLRELLKFRRKKMGTYISNVKGTTILTASGNIFAGPARVLGIYYVSDTTAGSIEITDGNGGTSLAKFATPLGAAVASQEIPYYISIPGDGIRCETNPYAVLINVNKVTFIYG